MFSGRDEQNLFKISLSKYFKQMYPIAETNRTGSWRQKLSDSPWVGTSISLREITDLKKIIQSVQYFPLMQEI